MCLYVDHVREPWGQKQLTRSRCRLGADSDGPKELRVRWGSPYPQGNGQFLRFVRLIEKHWQPTQKRLNRSRCRLGADSSWAQGTMC